MATFEEVGRDNWEEFLASDQAVLMLGKTDCAACKAFAKELEAFVEETDDWDGVRIGKMYLDKPGLLGFKKASPWLADVRDLPYTVIYSDGEVEKSFLGGGIERLLRRMERVFGDAR